MCHSAKVSLCLGGWGGSGKALGRFWELVFEWFRGGFGVAVGGRGYKIDTLAHNPRGSMLRVGTTCRTSMDTHARVEWGGGVEGGSGGGDGSPPGSKCCGRAPGNDPSH